MKKVYLIAVILLVFGGVSAYSQGSFGTFVTIFQGGNSAAVKAASTAPGATDPALVVGLSPNAPTPAGTNIIGKFGIDQTTLGTTNGVSLAQVGTTTVSTGAGATGTGTQRVGVAQDTTTIAGSAPGTAGSPSTQVLSVQGASGGTNLPTQGAYFTNVVSSTLTRASNTTAYAANETVCLLTSTTVCAPLTISIANTNAGKGLINRVTLLKSGSSVTSAAFTVWLFSAAPGTATPSQFDATSYTGPRAADMPNYIGAANCTAPVLTSDTTAQVWYDCTLSNPNSAGTLDFQALSGSTNINALISVTAAYTPASAETFSVAVSGIY